MRPSLPLLFVAALAAACTTVPQSPPVAPAPAAPSSEQLVQAGQLTSYAAALQELQGSATAQAEVMQKAREDYETARAGPAALRFGLLLAAPAHQQRDPKLAQRVLQEAMARSELLSVAERALGAVELKRVASELDLVAEIDRLVAELQQERERTRAATANTALNKRLQAEIEESARLRKALDEARAKLDAITRLELGISNRPPASEGRNQ